MLKHKKPLNVMVVLLGVLSACAQANVDTVEVMLIDTLDDERGYCLDVAGGKGANAPVEKGLQAHICYHYTGQILEDQGFEHALIEEGTFILPFFDVCMTALTFDVGAPLALSSCEALDTQKFELQANGQLVSKTVPNLCVTVSSTEKREGRGGRARA